MSQDAGRLFTLSRFQRRHRQSSLALPISRLPARFQSTVSHTTPIANIQPEYASPKQPISGTSGEELISTPLDDVITSIGSPVREHLGFLKEMGLDYGWGPTAFMETLIEHVHIYAGTPWWASIAISMVIIRGILLKFYFDAADTSARNQLISEHTTPMMDRYKAAAVAQDRVAMQQASAEMKEMRRAAGIKMWKLYVPMLQIPLGFGTFRLMRGMAHLPVPGFDSGGFLWIQDLTLSDPTFILPALTSACYYYTFKLGGEQGNNAMMSPTVQKVFLYVLPPFSFLIQLFWPAGLQFTFFVTGVIGFVQSSILRQLWFRKSVGIQPLPQHMGVNTKPKTGVYNGTINRYQPPASPSATPEKGKGFLGGAFSDIQGAASELVKAGKKRMGTGKTEAGKRTAAELRHAKDYDARRKREQAQEQFERKQEQQAKTRENAERRGRKRN